MIGINKDKYKIKILRKKLVFRDIVFWLICLSQIIAAIHYCDLTDYRVYYQQYNRIRESISLTYLLEPGYLLLNKFFVKLGFSFQEFYAVYICFTLYLIYNYVSKKTKYRYLAVLLFMVYPYVNFLQQLRSALGVAIILNGLKYLENSKDKFGLLKYIICVVIATSLQITNILFLIFIVVNYISLKKIKNLVGAAFFIVPASIYGGYRIIYKYIASITFLERIMHNLPQVRTITKFSLFVYILFFLCYIFFLIVMHYVEKDKIVLIEFEMKVSLLIILLSLLICLSDNAYRLAALMLPGVYVALLNMIMFIKRKHIRIISYLFTFLLAFTIFWGMWGPLNKNMNNILRNVMWKVDDYYY